MTLRCVAGLRSIGIGRLKPAWVLSGLLVHSGKLDWAIRAYAKEHMSRDLFHPVDPATGRTSALASAGQRLPGVRHLASGVTFSTPPGVDEGQETPCDIGFFGGQVHGLVGIREHIVQLELSEPHPRDVRD